MQQSDLRNLLLGPAFQPKVLDIPTPQALLDKGVPADILRLVSMSATERYNVYASFSDTTLMLNSALLVATALRMRDEGGPDGKGTPVFSAVDARVLIEQDAELIDALAGIVKPFLGIGNTTALVDAAKNDSGAAQQNQDGSQPNTGGSELPPVSDSPPSESVNPESETPIS